MESFGNTQPLEIGERRITFNERGIDLDDYASSRGLFQVKIAGVLGLFDLAGFLIVLDARNGTCTLANEGTYAFDVATLTVKRDQGRWVTDVDVGGRTLTMEIDFARRKSCLPVEFVGQGVIACLSNAPVGFGNMSVYLIIGGPTSKLEDSPIAGLDGILGCGEFLEQFQLIIQQSPSQDSLKVMLLDHDIISRSTAEHGVDEETVQLVS